MTKENDGVAGSNGLAVLAHPFWVPLGTHPVEECVHVVPRTYETLPSPISHTPHRSPTYFDPLHTPRPLLACYSVPDRSLFRAPTCPLVRRRSSDTDRRAQEIERMSAGRMIVHRVS